MKLARTVAVVALAVSASLPLHAQDAARKKPVKSLEDSIARAIKTAKKSSEQKIVRANILNGAHEDDETYLVICEYATGDIGIFEGGLESETDHWFMIEKQNVEALSEISKRALERR